MKRGFVMVVLLAILVALTAVLAAVLISNRQSAVIVLRESDEMKARSIAEQCLSKGIAVAVEHFRQRGGDEFDFDGLLDPDGVSGNGDDHVFSNVVGTNTRLFVPANAAGTAQQALYRYAFERVDPDGSGPDAPGGCYLRFDDNADDNLPGYTAQTGNTGGVAEGAGVNVNNRDRDASIVVTAIGIYPAFTTTADVDAYGKAHARVTLKQYFSATSAPAIYGNGHITIANNSEFCGTGGVRGVDVDIASSSCVCGDSLARSINSSTTTTTVDECGVSRCPRAAVGSLNDPTVLPRATPFLTEFAEQCLLYSETLGEEPSTFRIDDPVAPGGSRVPALGGSGLRLHLRRDGAVFAWDARATTSALDTTISTTPCDGFPAVWPPADSTNTPANNTDKNAICAPLVDGGHGGFYCPITANPFDQEFCRRDASVIPGDPLAVPPIPDESIAAATSTVRCDKLNIAGTPATQSPLEGNTAAKNALCVTAALGANATCTPTADPLDRETCTPPATFVTCGNAADSFQPFDETIWPTFTTDITAFENTTCFSNGRTGTGATCVPLPGAHDPRRLCWRMVAKLDGTTEVDNDGIAEWESGGGFAVPVGAVAVPNMRGDTKLGPSDLDGASRTLVTNIGASATVTTSQPVLEFVPDRWRTTSGWNNTSSVRRLPTPTHIRIAQTPQQPTLTFTDNTRVGGVSWAVFGNVGTTSGTVSLVHFGNTSTTLVNYAGGAGSCTMESSTFPASVVDSAVATNNVQNVVLAASGDISIDASRFTAVGRVLGGGGLHVQTAGDATCLVGGLSFGGTSGGCGTAAACDAPGVCFENRVAVIGSILADNDLVAPRGVFAQRGNVASGTSLKISQLMSRRNVCINGSSRIAGQIISERLGGNIDVGPDLLMLQSGEVGVGFSTKKTTWTDSSW